jgi:hypothetical protein
MISKDDAIKRIEEIHWTSTSKELHIELFKEFLRRASMWKDYLKATPKIVFFDPCRYLDKDFDLDEPDRNRIETLTSDLNGYIPSICYSYIKYCAYMEQNRAEKDILPNMYEPLIKILESGGRFLTHHGFAEVAGYSFHLKDWDSFRSEKPFVSL